MSSARDNRQRAAARARLEREMAARLEAAARRKRVVRMWLGGGVAAVLLAGAVVWIVTALSSGTTPVAAAPSCTWVPEPTNPGNPSASPSASASASPSASASAGTPAPSSSVSASPASSLPETNPPRTGYRLMTITTDQGVVKIEMNLAKAPCTAASMTHLAETAFYTTNTNPQTGSCHRMVADIYVLQCGDPTGTGSGGPGYRFADENLQTDRRPAYHAGDVAMANSSQPVTNGSQFFFVYQDSDLPGNYSLWGHVVEGLDVIRKVAAGGDDDRFNQQNGGSGGGQPLTLLHFLKVEVGPTYPASVITPTPTPSTSGSASAAASASASNAPTGS